MFFHPDNNGSCDKNKNIMWYNGSVKDTTPLTEFANKFKSMKIIMKDLNKMEKNEK